MIRETQGDILASDAEALVNPVNTEGVMGAGLAAQFRAKYPEMYEMYAWRCQRGFMAVGSVHVHRVHVYHPSTTRRPHEFVISFPTKDHWRNPSQLQWIDTGLADLRRQIETLNIRSIAIPPLGCGLGGLRWADVRPLIERHLGDLGEVDVVLYAPESSG